MAKRDIIVIGASAGGVEALSRLVGALPENFPAAIFVTVHFPRTAQSVLPRVLARSSRLTARHPADGESIQSGVIYAAPPDFHLLLTAGTIRLVRGPTENGNRPAVDPMFRSAALAYGNRVIGVVLTGNLDDGTAGMLEIRRRGGIGIAQDPAEALFASMPQSVIEHGLANHVASLDELAGLLQTLVLEEVESVPQNSGGKDSEREAAYSAFDMGVIEDPAHHPGEPSPYSCPDCGGVLWDIKDRELRRFRCRVGHAWTNDALLMQQTDSLEAALWMALRALEENASLNRQMAERARHRGFTQMVERHTSNAELAERRADVVRQAIVSDSPVSIDATSAAVGIGGPLAVAKKAQ